MMEETVRVARIAPHFWEEPCISGTRGSGTVFFVGCLLRCVYCQNHEISRPARPVGRRLTVDALADAFLRLQTEDRVHNINLVTASHIYAPVANALEKARARGLTVPVVYNSSGYETEDTLKALYGLVDVYLPDLKYLTPALAETLSGREDYPYVATRAIAEMVRQTGSPLFDRDGMLVKGTLVRHLVLPGHTKEAKDVIRHLHETYGDAVILSILRQYTPMPGMTGDLARVLTKREYDRVTDYAIDLGVECAFLQEAGVSRKSFIPSWDKDV